MRNNQLWNKPWIGTWAYMVGVQERGQSCRYRFGRKPGKFDITKAKKSVFLKGRSRVGCHRVEVRGRAAGRDRTWVPRDMDGGHPRGVRGRDG